MIVNQIRFRLKLLPHRLPYHGVLVLRLYRLSDVASRSPLRSLLSEFAEQAFVESALGIDTLLSQCEDGAGQLSHLLDGGPWHFADLEI